MAGPAAGATAAATADEAAAWRVAALAAEAAGSRGRCPPYGAATVGHNMAEDFSVVVFLIVMVNY